MIDAYTHHSAPEVLKWLFKPSSTLAKVLKLLVKLSSTLAFANIYEQPLLERVTASNKFRSTPGEKLKSLKCPDISKPPSACGILSYVQRQVLSEWRNISTCI